LKNVPQHFLVGAKLCEVVPEKMNLAIRISLMNFEKQKTILNLILKRLIKLKPWPHSVGSGVNIYYFYNPKNH